MLRQNLVAVFCDEHEFRDDDGEPPEESSDEGACPEGRLCHSSVEHLTENARPEDSAVPARINTFSFVITVTPKRIV